jgi:DNA-binding transcriptional MerR regulator
VHDGYELLQIGEFAELVGLSVPQLRRYDRLRLLAPEGRTDAGYRYYNSGQTGAGRVIALLRSMDMPIADIRLVLSGVTEAERQQLLSHHRSRLEARLDEVRSLLDAVDRLSQKEDETMDRSTELSSWLHLMPHLPVSDLEESITYYQEALGFRLAWQTTDDKLAALASGAGELLLLVPWEGVGSPPAQSAYVYVEDPDALCAEYEQAGATIVETVASRPYGMRDFCVSDPDGHRFTLGRGEESLADVAEYYGMSAGEITANPEWLENRT